MILRAAVAAILAFGVVEVPVLVVNVLAARLIFQVMSHSTVSIVSAVGPVDSSQLISSVTHIIVISSCGGILWHSRVSDGLIKRLLECFLPDWV